MTPAVANELMGWSSIGAIVVLIVFLATLPLAGKQKPQSRPTARRREAEPSRTPPREEEQRAEREESLTVRPVPAPPAPREPQPGDPEFYERQAALVQERGFYRSKRLLNKSEQRIFWALIRWARQHDYRVFPQVALGEVFSSDDDEHYFAVNSKRADFILTDSRFEPLAIIEYHGSGHWLSSNARARDSVKQAAAESAGLAYIEIHRGQEQHAARLVEEGLESMRQAAAERAVALRQQLDQFQRIAGSARPSSR